MNPNEEITREQVFLALSELPSAAQELAHRKSIVIRTPACKRVELIAHRVRVISREQPVWAWQCQWGEEVLIWPVPQP
jgi:hypothetical protein